MTKIHMEPKWSDVKPNGYYVYLHRRKSDGTLFYVGRGTGNRGWQAYSGYRSPWWTNVSMKHGVIVDIAQDCLSSECADLLEEWLIAKLRSEGENLINLTDGGGGTTGWVPSDETRAKWSKAKSRPVVNSDGMKFESIKSAVTFLMSIGFKRAGQGAISSCCLGHSNSAYGYAWWYEGDDPKKIITRSESARHKRGKSLLRSDGKVYGSLTEAGEGLRNEGVSVGSLGNISVAARCKGKVSYGYTWQYI